MPLITELCPPAHSSLILHASPIMTLSPPPSTNKPLHEKTFFFGRSLLCSSGVQDVSSFSGHYIWPATSKSSVSPLLVVGLQTGCSLWARPVLRPNLHGPYRPPTRLNSCVSTLDGSLDHNYQSIVFAYEQSKINTSIKHIKYFLLICYFWDY